MSIYFLSGTTRWASKKLSEKYPKYSLDLYLDDASLSIYKTSGIRVLPKTDPDGNVFYKLSRPKELTKKDGEIIQLGPFNFLNADGSEYNGLIGNGSKVTVKVAVYETGAGIGHRVETIRVDDLVVYAPAQVANVPSVGLPF